jgi:cell division protein FtsL
MAASAEARSALDAPRRRQHAAPSSARSRAQAGIRPRLTRAFVIFVVCLAVLAAGRVAVSFAVVQKTVATDAIAREERVVAAENAQLAEKLAHLGSTVRIRTIAEKRLGFVDAAHVKYVAVANPEAKVDKGH